MRKKLLSILALLCLTVTSAWAQNPLVQAAKNELGKIVVVADIFGLDTSNAKALIANDDASLTDLRSELETLGTATKEKTSDAVDNAEQFFNKFNPTAAAALADDFTNVRTALESATSFDAITEALQTLANNALVVGQETLLKVDEYLRKMEDETLNAHLDDIKAKMATWTGSASDLLGLMEDIEGMKKDMTDVATTYMTKVNTLITEGKSDGKDVSAVETAFNNAFAKAFAYKSGSATMVDLGVALKDLINAVEEYEEAQEIITGISGFTAEKQNNATIYNLNGQRVEKAQKGLYIINGKKVMVK